MANKRLNAVITIGGAVAGSLRSAFGTVTSETNKLGTAIQRLTDRQRELRRIADDFNAGKSGSAMRAYYAQQELDAIGKQIKALRQRDALEKSRAANQAQRSELRGKIGSTVATGAALALPIGAAVNKAATFQYELQMIGNTAEMSAADIAKMGRTILQVSKDTQQSATNVRQGMGFLVAAGMKPAEATQFLGSIGKTATAYNAEVEDLSKTVFTLADALKIKPEGMESALDTLAQAGKEGNVELKDMAKSLPVLGSGFVALKMQGREAAATIGAALQIARKGAGDADEAANNMKNFIAKIMSPETLKKAKKNFGLDLYKVIVDAQKGGQNPFEAAMAAIMKATKGDQKAIGELFTDMQVQNFIRPMIQNWDEYVRVKKAALGADGVISRDFASIVATDKQKLNELANSLERLGIALGGVFAGSGQAGNGLADYIGKATEFINTHRELVGTTIKVVGGLFAARLAVLGVGYAWNMATGAWLAGRAAWLAAPAIISAVGAAATFTQARLAMIGPVLGVLAKRFLAVLAIANAADAIAGSMGVGKGEIDQAQDEKNWERMNWWQKAQSGTARGVEHIGRAIGATNMANQAQQDRISSETAYLNENNGLPPVPAMASRGGATVQDNSTNSYTIVQQPGQDARALADELERRRRQQAGVRARSSLVDGVGAQ